MIYGLMACAVWRLAVPFHGTPWKWVRVVKSRGKLKGCKSGLQAISCVLPAGVSPLLLIWQSLSANAPCGIAKLLRVWCIIAGSWCLLCTPLRSFDARCVFGGSPEVHRDIPTPSPCSDQSQLDSNGRICFMRCGVPTRSDGTPLTFCV